MGSKRIPNEVPCCVLFAKGLSTLVGMGGNLLDSKPACEVPSVLMENEPQTDSEMIVAVTQALTLPLVSFGPF